MTLPYESPFEHAASTSLRKVSIGFLTWVFVMMLFVVPTHRLTVNKISYAPFCAKNATLSTYGDTGTTYDKTLGSDHYETVKLPIMMTVVLDGLSGFTNAAITAIPCQTNVQEISDTIDTTRLTHDLSHQVQRFQDECFAPARVRFDHRHPEKSTYETTMNNYGGESDLSWIGSYVMQKLYYSDIYPIETVQGFPYSEYPNQYDEFNKKHGYTETSKWGYPSCQEWWTNPDHGLKQQLVSNDNYNSLLLTP
ncbi:MAG: hypothetical protein GY821_00340 [Gammaproteobacteria bacterium]|nr:hypothetical protein [Gammaproteobacteria bacterium]